jgi:hypothetical protein
MGYDFWALKERFLRTIHTKKLHSGFSLGLCQRNEISPVSYILGSSAKQNFILLFLDTVGFEKTKNCIQGSLSDYVKEMKSRLSHTF